MAFVDWITGREGQAVIADYTIGGEPLFFPDPDKRWPSRKTSGREDAKYTGDSRYSSFLASSRLNSVPEVYHDARPSRM
jgi:hypothetical protein